jgi:enoyl-CoA hydratase/carnithine racemase
VAVTDSVPLDPLALPGDVHIEIVDRVAVVRLDAPQTKNALNLRMILALQTAWRELDDDPGVGACVITGSGDALCSGLHKSLLPRVDELAASGVRFEYSPLQFGFAKPVIVAWHGAAAGAGLQFLADADVVFATPTAFAFDPHLKFGVPVGNAAVALKASIPGQLLRYLLLSGGDTRINASRAADLGLVAEVLDDSRQLEQRAISFARQAALFDARAVRATLQLLRDLGPATHGRGIS